MTHLKTPLTTLAWAVGMALVTLSGAAVAVPVLTADTTASANGVPGTPSGTVTVPYVNSSTSKSDPAGNGYAYSFASDSGAYAVSSNAQGIATATASATYLQTMTNTSTRALRYSMSFHIYSGFMSTSLNGSAVLTGSEFLRALYSAEVSVNGSSKFFSKAIVERTATGVTETKTGDDLNPADVTNDGEYSWSNAYYTVDLGLVAAGGSIDVLATLHDETSSNVGTYTFDNGNCCDPYGCPTSIPGSTASEGGESSNAAYGGNCGTGTDFKGLATAFYGDPIEFGTSPDATRFTISAVNDVPEPGMFGLAFLALGSAAWVTRRRRQG